MHKRFFWYIIIFSGGGFWFLFLSFFSNTNHIVFYLTENRAFVVRNRKQEGPNFSSHQKNQCERCLPEPNLNS